MMKLISEAFKFIGKSFIYISRKVYLSPQEKRVQPWFKVNGDETLRLNYDLNEHSVVFDLGGYKGQWTSDIYAMYDSYVFVFEPVPLFANRIKQRFFQNNKISIYDFGLASHSYEARIFLSNDASSTFKEKGKEVEIRLFNVLDFIQENSIYYIDLMKINIEGGEYELLETIIDSGLLANIGNIQVQFHDFVDDALHKMQKIQNELEKTHYLTYQYEFVWENWRKRT